ncbi:hypothetical protein M3592_11725 [Priestia aryabhattai]|uniref:hypothetical protein n=1 Tax=Priestia TaxID=2800373 RepID=UPI000BF749BC|nr:MULTISPECIES: hypothetical protein [Priestia]MCM2976105.1 hypothetical protein [Priestia aryabhattai]MED3989311.1 hypothetical protein [Priestia aryabhattai]PGA18144.1 hypothetical protein COL65_11010 [Priestia aryabhattai]
MKNTQQALSVDDYLDLYLLAKELKDETWQQELLAALKTKQNRSFEDKQSALVQEIWEDFKQLNEDISFTYRLIQEEPTNEQFQVKLMNLRERRITLSRELYLAKKQYVEHTQ